MILPSLLFSRLLVIENRIAEPLSPILHQIKLALDDKIVLWPVKFNEDWVLKKIERKVYSLFDFDDNSLDTSCELLKISDLSQNLELRY